MRIIFTLIVLVISQAPRTSFAEEGAVKHTVKEGYQDVKKNTQKAYRKTKDKTCQLMNGKMECKAKEIKHEFENKKDEMMDKANDQ